MTVLPKQWSLAPSRNLAFLAMRPRITTTGLGLRSRTGRILIQFGTGRRMKLIERRKPKDDQFGTKTTVFALQESSVNTASLTRSSIVLDDSPVNRTSSHPIFFDKS